MQELPKDRIVECVEQIEQAIPKLPATECPGVLGDLARLSAQVQMKMTVPHAQTEEPEEKLLDINQVAERLNITISRVRELSRRKDGFPVQHIGKYVRVKQSDLWQWVEGLQEKGLDKRLDHRYTMKYERKGAPSTSEKNGNHSGRVR